MTQAPTAIDRIRYNPETGSFWARVRISRNRIDYTYHCEIEAPITADFETLAPAFARAARAAHLSDKASLRSFLRDPDRILHQAA